MTTPLTNPITLNIVLETQEDLIALLLRANLDPGNLAEWYHDHRQRPQVVVPDVRMSGLFKTLKAHMESEGFSYITDAPDAAPAAIEVRMG